MNGSLEHSTALVKGIVDGLGEALSCDVVLCPPFTLLDRVSAMIANADIQLGAQTLSEHTPGAFTGEVDADMLLEVGCSHVIVGHSERRSLFGESDDTVARKFARAMERGLVPILCVGETLQERESNQTKTVVCRQIDAVITSLGAEVFAKGIVAYEPVWAIGTGRTATPEQADSVHWFIRERVGRAGGTVADGLRILYGGSVKAENAGTMFAMPNIDGGLVGGASLKVNDFLGICGAVG